MTESAQSNPEIKLRTLPPTQFVNNRHLPPPTKSSSSKGLGLVNLERHRRDPSAILKVRLRIDQAEALFTHLGETGPQEERESLARLFQDAGSRQVPAHHASGWQTFCTRFAEAALTGSSIQPFDRANTEQTREILAALPAILAWNGESYLRFASSILFGDSKRLEALRSRIENCLCLITGGQSDGLSDFGIHDHDRSLLLHSPVTFQFAGHLLDLGAPGSPIRIAASDIRRAGIATEASRCLTVENVAMLHVFGGQVTNLDRICAVQPGNQATHATADTICQ